MKKHLIGAVFLALCILVAIPLGANRSFARLREEAQASYYYDSTGYGLYNGLEARQEAAKNLITLAEKYVSQNPDLSSYIDDLDYRVKLAENLNYAPDVLDQEITADLNMGQAAQSLYERLEETELAEKDAKYPRQLMAELESEADKLIRSSYNDDARAYNARLEKFPIRFLRYIARIKTMAVFERAT